VLTSVIYQFIQYSIIIFSFLLIYTRVR